MCKVYFDQKRARLQLEAGGTEQQLGKGGKGEKADVVLAVSQICPKVPYTHPKNIKCTQPFRQIHFHITDTPSPKLGNKEERGAS